VRIVAATISADPFGITEKTLRTKVDAAALPGRADHDFADGFDESAVAVGDDEADTGQAAFPRRAQELGPEGLGLAVPDRDAEHFAAAILGDAGRDDDGLGHDLVVESGLDVGGVEKEAGEPDVIQGPAPERVELFVEAGADPRHLALGYAGVRAEGFDQVVDGAGGDSVDVGLHDDCVEGLVDAAPAFGRLGKKLPARSFGIANSRSPACVVTLFSRCPLR
jgi:hypothetical protein